MRVLSSFSLLFNITYARKQFVCFVLNCTQKHKNITCCAWAGGTPGRILLSQIDIRFWRVFYLFLSNCMLTVIDVTSLVTSLLHLWSCCSATQTQLYRTHWQTHQYTRYAWAGGTFFPVVLLCQFFGCGGNSFRWYLPTIPVVPLCLFFVAAGNSFLVAQVSFLVVAGNIFRWYFLTYRTIPVVPLCQFFGCGGK